ncbi:MAG: hypothetical protein FWD92_05225 [Methanomassiliicoccaceae archaeon]|nr:hypothetical protein [Methanomassiliicoccaceae archaeon]
MDIPVMPLHVKGRNILTGDMRFSGTSVSVTDDSVNYKDLLTSLYGVCSKETPVAAVDVKGMKKRDITSEILKDIRSKRDIWVMTGIIDAGDMMDAFQGNINKLIVPYHLTSDYNLREMIMLSDCCVPALFVDNGNVYPLGRKNDLRNALRTLERMNFEKVLVFDVSSEYSPGMWERIVDHSDTVIPYAASSDAAAEIRERGFNDIMISAVRLLQNTGSYR